MKSKNGILREWWSILTWNERIGTIITFPLRIVPFIFIPIVWLTDVVNAESKHTKLKWLKENYPDEYARQLEIGQKREGDFLD